MYQKKYREPPNRVTLYVPGLHKAGIEQLFIMLEKRNEQLVQLSISPANCGGDVANSIISQRIKIMEAIAAARN